MPTAKRELTLADKIVMDYRRESLVTKLVHDRFIGRVRAAKQFVLDAAACKRIGAVIRDMPELLFREQQFARAPYDITWLEWQSRVMWEEINQQPSAYDSDGRIGMLIDHGTVYTVADVEAARATGVTLREAKFGARLMPFVYELHTPWDDHDAEAFRKRCEIAEYLQDSNAEINVGGLFVGINQVPKDQLSDLQRYLLDTPTLDYLYWGSAYTQDLNHIANLRRAHSMRVLPTVPPYGPKQAGQILGHCAGDLRNIIGILLMLNRPSVVRYVRDMPHMRGFVGGKLRSYMTHTECTIDLDPTPVLRRIGTAMGEGDTKRRHEVRYHWCHDEVYRKGTAAGCIHTWVPHPDYIEDIDHLHVDVATGAVEWNNFKCTSCGGHRWWREKHERGDASKGWVEKGYQVTA